MTFERNPAQVAFYRSKAWKRARAAYMEKAHHICERCGKPAKIVHHKRHIDAGNVGDAAVTLDFGNLEALCQDCHNREHFGESATEDGLTFDAEGNLTRE